MTAGPSHTQLDAWAKWRVDSRARAEGSWSRVQSVGAPSTSGVEWRDGIRRQFQRLMRMKMLLDPGAYLGVEKISFGELSDADQKRLRNRRDDLYLIGMKSPIGFEFGDGKHLREGRLKLQVFIDVASGRPVGMNIMMRGVLVETGVGDFIRYDLDAVPMGEARGPVTHFQSHWHHGIDPDRAPVCEPRLPSPILDPCAVIDLLVETYFPEGPADLV